VAGKNTQGINARSWYGRALSAGMEVLDMDALDLPDLQSQQEAVIELGSMPFKIDHFQIAWERAVQGHQEQVSNIESGALAKALAAKLLEEEREQPDPEKLDEGTNFHKVLEFLTAQSGKDSAITLPTEQELMNWLRIDQASAQQLLGHAERVFDAPALKDYLSSGGWLQAWNELDMVSENGRSFRIDRLVEFDDHLAIIDYKLTIPEEGSAAYEKYRAQLNNYKHELERIRKDKPNKAFLISSLGEIKEVI
jgi:ATP-dependent helicase/nuclease subunit A